jgi:6-phosphogluconolactonase
LSPVEQVSSKGKWPRNFAIDPTGAFMFVANEKSGNVTVFRIHPKTGRLSPAGQSFHVPSPACVRFVPSR